jgi:peptide-methionine (S)-S-oxide reductase
VWSSAKSKLPTPEEALPGRATRMPVAKRHFVNGAPLAPPFPAGVRIATFGMGCFWGAEKKFWQQEGVFSTAVGYAGGTTPNPTYREVCSGLTGHAEVVQVVFDPRVVSYEQLLKIFWENHDPTQGMRQGNDQGTQYRSAIYTHDDSSAPRPSPHVRLTRARSSRTKMPVTAPSRPRSRPRLSSTSPRMITSSISRRIPTAIAAWAARA